MQVVEQESIRVAERVLIKNENGDHEDSSKILIQRFDEGVGKGRDSGSRGLGRVSIKKTQRARSSSDKGSDNGEVRVFERVSRRVPMMVLMREENGAWSGCRRGCR